MPSGRWINFLTVLFIIAGFALIVASLISQKITNNQQENLTLGTPSPQSEVKGQQAIPVNNDQTAQDRQKAKVVRVIDGDTIELEGGQKVRYIGIDAPEQTTAECFARESTAKNRELVIDKVIELEKDVSETDRYGRLLRSIFLDDIFINQYLVQEGFAKASSYPPDIKYQQLITDAQTQAQSQNKGLWSGCQGESPRGDCLIKGNISSSGEKIYHLPGQKYYEKTIIDESRGERWFCSEEDAQATGWRKSKI